MIKKIGLIFILLLINLNATTITELFDAIKKQPISKIDEISYKMANVSQNKISALYYPKVDIFASYTHYNTPSSLRPLDPLATGTLISNNEPLGFANTIQKVGVNISIPLFIKELHSLKEKAKHLTKSVKLKKRLNYLQNEALILGANSSLEYLENLIISLKSTQKSLLKTKLDLQISVNSGRSPAIAIDKIDEKLNQLDISINSIEIKKSTLLSNIENLTNIELNSSASMKLSSKIDKKELFSLKPLEELIRASVSDYKASKEKRYYPKVSLNAMWSENYAQNDVNTHSNVNLGYGYYQVGVSIPIYHKNDDIDIQLKEIEVLKNQTKLKKTEQELKTQVKALQKSLILLEKSKKLKTINIQKKEDLLKYAKVAFTQGRITEEDYLTYEDGVLNAKSSYFETISQKWQTIAKLAVIYGNDLKGLIK